MALGADRKTGNGQMVVVVDDLLQLRIEILLVHLMKEKITFRSRIFDILSCHGFGTEWLRLVTVQQSKFVVEQELARNQGDLGLHVYFLRRMCIYDDKLHVTHFVTTMTQYQQQM